MSRRARVFIRCTTQFFIRRKYAKFNGIEFHRSCLCFQPAVELGKLEIKNADERVPPVSSASADKQTYFRESTCKKAYFDEPKVAIPDTGGVKCFEFGIEFKKRII